MALSYWLYCYYRARSLWSSLSSALSLFVRDAISIRLLSDFVETELALSTIDSSFFAFNNLSNKIKCRVSVWHVNEANFQKLIKKRYLSRAWNWTTVFGTVGTLNHDHQDAMDRACTNARKTLLFHLHWIWVVLFDEWHKTTRNNLSSEGDRLRIRRASSSRDLFVSIFLEILNTLQLVKLKFKICQHFPCSTSRPNHRQSG